MDALGDDAAVIEASWSDPVLFGVIFDRHATRVRRYLVRRLGPDDGDSMLGEVFRIAFERRLGFETDRTSAAPWLYGIATNLVAHQRRSERRRLHAVARLAARRPEPDDVAEVVSVSVDAAARWREVADLVAALPPIERDTIVLAAWEGLSYDDIAAALEIPVGTVRSRINRARGRIRELDVARGDERDERDERDESTPLHRAGRIGS